MSDLLTRTRNIVYNIGNETLEGIFGEHPKVPVVDEVLTQLSEDELEYLKAENEDSVFGTILINYILRCQQEKGKLKDEPIEQPNQLNLKLLRNMVSELFVKELSTHMLSGGLGNLRGTSRLANYTTLIMASGLNLEEQVDKSLELATAVLNDTPDGHPAKASMSMFLKLFKERREIFIRGLNRIHKEGIIKYG